MRLVYEVMALAGQGLEGDRYAAGKGSFNQGEVGRRQVTLINARFFINTPFEYLDSRRNLVIRGTELMWLMGQKFQVGDATFRGIKYCDPCLRPNKLVNKATSFKETFEDCGGLIAEVLAGGLIRLNSSVVVPPKGY